MAAARSIPLDDVIVNSLYVDMMDTNRRETDVYGNGKMQAMVIPYAEYEGQDKNVTKDDLVAHVKNHVVIYVIKDNGDKVPLDWEKSFVSNEYNHDINHGASSNAPVTGSSVAPPLSDDDQLNAFVPFYFTVQAYVSGEYRLVAKYNGRFTPDDALVTVKCWSFSVTENNFEITDIDQYKDATLRAIRYKPTTIPLPLKLVKCVEYKGIRFDSSEDGSVHGNCWVSFTYSAGFFDVNSYVGAFLDYDKASESAVVAKMSEKYTFYTKCMTISVDVPIPSPSPMKSFLTPRTTFFGHSDDNWNQPEYFSPQQIKSAWRAGIAMVLLSEDYYLEGSMEMAIPPAPGSWDCYYHLSEFKVEDNYGNMMLVDIDVDNESWTIKNPKVVCN